MPSPHEYLLVRLWGPMASWGTIAVGEQRQTWTRPSRSAVLGLVAAALGLERTHAEAHQELEACLGLALRIDSEGSPLRDYHTAQAPQQESGRRWRSRYDEVRRSKTLNTILSERWYYTGMNVVVALWLRPGKHAPALADIAGRLRRPVFTPYLGRKASPLGIPMRPRLVASSGLWAAFRDFDAAERDEATAWAADKRQYWAMPVLASGMEPPAELWLGASDLDHIGPHRVAERVERRDSIRDRRTWTFDDRAEVRILQEGTT